MSMFTEDKKDTEFTVPTPVEVAEYCSEHLIVLPLDEVQKFWRYWNEKDWTSDGHKVQWHRTLATWYGNWKKAFNEQVTVYEKPKPVVNHKYSELPDELQCAWEFNRHEYDRCWGLAQLLACYDEIMELEQWKIDHNISKNEDWARRHNWDKCPMRLTFWFEYLDWMLENNYEKLYPKMFKVGSKTFCGIMDAWHIDWLED